MKAALVRLLDDIEVVEMPTPEIGEGELLVEMKAVGLCGSDLAPWYVASKAPTVLGHEPSGIVAAVPRKGVMELTRMLSDDADDVTLAVGRNHIRLVKGETTFTSKLIDGRFPDYKAVVPVGADKQMLIDRAIFIHALQRAAILSKEKYKGVRLEAEGSTIKIIAHNPQQEEAVEEIEAEFNFDRLAVGFNVTYLLDALTAIDTEMVSLELKDANSSCLISAPNSDVNRHVVMPLKL